MKDYLGDSVYADLHNGMILLTTENGKPDDPSNAIYIDREVFISLTRYAKRVWGKLPDTP